MPSAGGGTKDRKETGREHFEGEAFDCETLQVCIPYFVTTIMICTIVLTMEPCVQDPAGDTETLSEEDPEDSDQVGDSHAAGHADSGPWVGERWVERNVDAQGWLRVETGSASS